MKKIIETEYRNTSLIWYQNQPGIIYSSRINNKKTLKEIKEEEYREAALIWRKNNPQAKSIKQKEKITITNGKVINLGIKMANMRFNIAKLNAEEISFWQNFGLLEGRPTEEEYREAAIIWRKNNPYNKKIKLNEEVVISNGKIVNLGNKVHHIRYSLNDLPKEAKEFWKKFGLAEICPKEAEYREAALIWRENNPNAKKIKQKEKITISNGKIINLGKRMNRIYCGLVKLNQEQKEFWSNFGYSSTEKSKELIIKIAAEIAKKYNISFNELLYMYETVEEYQHLEVGLETNYELKVQKIINYNYNEMDIEESYFLALNFKQRVLEQKQEEYLKRNELLRQFIIDWNYFTEEEKKEEIQKYFLTLEEIEFINNSRKELDNMCLSLKK